MTFLELIEKTLEKSDIPLTIQEIWEHADEFGYVKKLQSNGKTPTKTIGAILYREIKDNTDTIFSQYGKNPSRFYIKSKGTPNNIQECKKTEEKFKERDLHPLLTKYIYSDRHFKCYAKTIFHEKSSRKRKGVNEWLHPDIVGIHFPFESYTKDTIDFIESLNDCQCRLFSFELKTKVDFSTLREYYFQAVSNSSWAHEGYLVALEYDDDIELQDEMLRLNNAFGIGFIKLNAERAEESEIIIASKQKNQLDWDTIDRLVEINSDFKNFINYSKDSISSQRVHDSDFDKIFDDEEIKKHIKNKEITKI